jgi:hypothetical protein
MYLPTAPEHKFPSAVDDSIAVTEAVLDNPEDFYASSTACVGVGGDRYIDIML